MSAVVCRHCSILTLATRCAAAMTCALDDEPGQLDASPNGGCTSEVINRALNVQ